MRLFSIFFRYTLSSHLANPGNLFAGMLGMLANNLIFLYGLWGMLFYGKPETQAVFEYFIVLTGVVNLSWGCINFFLGGLRALGDLINEGTLEPLLCTPRSSLFLAACSRSSPIALGDILTGLISLGVAAQRQGGMVLLQAIPVILVSAIGFAGVFILTGSLAFYLKKGSFIGMLVVEVILALSGYPTGKIFQDKTRWILMLTPTVLITILPMEAFETTNFSHFFLVILKSGWYACGFLSLAIIIFKRGLRRFQSVSLVGPTGL
jgi:ABC-type uncharacterized transport system permease subunit